MPGHLPFPIPLATLSSADRMVLEIEALRDVADDGGLGTLAYLLECALIEARHQAEQGRRDADESGADPDDLWRPLP